MGDSPGRLLEQQAGVGRRGEQPPAPTFLDERLVIERRFEAKQAEPEPILPARLAVAAAGVATEFGEDRNHLVGEMHRKARGKVFDAHRNRRRDLTNPHRDLGSTIAARGDQARVVDCCDTFIGGCELCLAREVTRLAVLYNRVDSQLLNGVRPAQQNISRRHAQTCRPRFARIVRPGMPLSAHNAAHHDRQRSDGIRDAPARRVCHLRSFTDSSSIKPLRRRTVSSRHSTRALDCTGGHVVWRVDRGRASFD